VPPFNWHSDPITSATVITPTYRSTHKVRRFFKSQCGDHFKFDLPFMAWLKSATGKTMADAVEEWRRRAMAAPQPASRNAAPAAPFDWHSNPITPATIITPTYRSTQNVRRFFKSQCGEHFKFDASFMAWMKSAAGRTMADAVAESRRRQPR
jgi:hypothetical protein